MARKISVTAEGYQALEQELEHLKTVRRNEISDKIRVARGFGDLSENSEYDEAKNEQAIVEARISQLEEQLKNAEILHPDHITKDQVSIGTIVTLRDVEMNDIMQYQIVTSLESNSKMDTITDESPVGRALLGHKVGQVVNVQIPSGAIIQYEIMAIDI